MNAETLPNLLDWVDAIGWTLLHFMWQGALIGAGYALLRVLVRSASPQARYALGLGTLALLACAPALTLWRLAPGGAVAVASASAAVMALPAMPVGATAALPLPIEPWLPWLVVFWLIGVSAVSLRAWMQYLRLHRLVRREATALPQWDARLRELVRRFGVSRPVRLVQSAIVQTPSLIGWLAPVIVLPASVLVGLTPKQLELVIAHELGHIRRWDFMVNLMQIALESVLFYHPVVHWISREVRNEREACCDDLVLRLGANPVDYASTLASLEELRGVTHAPALAISGGLLLGRIRRIVGAEPMFAAPVSSGQGLLLLAVACAALLVVRPMASNVLEKVSAPESVAAPAASLARAASPASQPASTRAADVVTRTAALAVERALAPPAIRESAPETVVTPAPEAPAVGQPLSTPRPMPRIASLSATAMAPEAGANAPVVIDLAYAAPALAPVGTPSAFISAPTTLQRSAPDYPVRATREGVEGSVTLSFVVDHGGRAREIRVVAANEPGWFEAAAIAALREWRFEPDRALDRFTQTFDFSLASADEAAAAREPCELRVGSRICRRLPDGAVEPMTTLGEIPR